MTRRSSFLSRLIENRDGAVAIVVILVAVPMLLAVGASIDYIRAYNSRTDLQSAADSAVLAAAAKYKSGMPEATISKTIDAFLSANGKLETAVVGEPEVASDESELCLNVSDAVPTTFMKVANIQSLPISIRSCAALPGVKQLEIALVLDVSSSMIEENRFTPMQTAVASFLQAFSSNASLVDKTKISIVPFSSRVNFGMAHTDWLKSYNGAAAVPKRWTDPKSVYTSSSYTLSYWIDGVTPLMSTSKNYYWMGCIEPRADVEVKDTGAIDDGMSDAPPATSAFVAMDANPKSGTSFCPPPVTPLTGDFAYLKKVVTNLTSEGSTRLDAGVVAGWYTLSPKWKGVWGDETSPAEVSDSVHKVMVFMTDGEMNTKYDPNGKFDWICSQTQSSTCNTVATSAMQAACTAMKKSDIEIYTLSYSADADVVNIRNCATNGAHFFTASPATIKTVYETIAAAIRGDTLRLTQ
ncbi:VWA domain-containing protein [Rhizobium sp. R635]|uniref:vWA domain-containing protein n=1 Tax=Rhizobium sp. R635 TaxID=1764275 RepID=UPI001FD8A207|nr:VWA domain-containing protein [Rhizobium sp. R635]